jgi:hypothetical protein
MVLLHKQNYIFILIQNDVYEAEVECMSWYTWKLGCDIIFNVFPVGKGRIARSSSSPASSAVEGTEENVGGDEDNGEHGSQDVLVIPFTPNVGESVGLIAEQKVSMTTLFLSLTL